MRINDKYVDAETAKMIQLAQKQLADGGTLDVDLQETLDNRMCRAYICGDMDLHKFINELMEQNYNNGQKKSR